jgi:hypothetical protein
MATVAEIPTEAGRPFIEKVTWNAVAYTLHFAWNVPAQCWTLDIWDASDTVPLLNGLAMTTGADLLGQFGYLPLASEAILIAMTTGPAVSPDMVPNFEDLGIDGHIYIVTP